MRTLVKLILSSFASVIVGGLLAAPRAAPDVTESAAQLERDFLARAEALLRREVGQFVADLEDYVEKYPGADDRDQALALIVSTAWDVDDYPRVLLAAETYERDFPQGKDIEEIRDKGTQAALRMPGPLGKAISRIDAHSRRPDTRPNEVVRLRSALADAWVERDRPEEAVKVIDDLLEASPATADERVGDALRQARADYASIGQPFRHFRTKDLSGRPVDTATLRGQVVLLDFWATWCAPCRASIPDLVELERNTRGRGFVIVGVNLDQKRDTLGAFLADEGINWTQVPDEQGDGESLSSRYDVSGIPNTILLDRQGRLYRRGLAGAELSRAVTKLLAR